MTGRKLFGDEGTLELGMEPNRPRKAPMVRRRFTKCPAIDEYFGLGSLGGSSQLGSGSTQGC